MHAHRLEPHRLAASLFQVHPDEAYEIALDFLNDSLSTQNREGAVVWTAVLTLIEQMQSDFDAEATLFRETRSTSIM